MRRTSSSWLNRALLAKQACGRPSRILGLPAVSGGARAEMTLY